MPCRCSRAPGPMPDNCRICGESMAPAARITSRRAGKPLARHQLDPGRARAGVARFHRQAPHLGVGPDGQVRPVHDGAQKRLGAAPAPAAALVHLEVGVAEVVAPVELGDLRNPALLGGVPPRVEDLPAHPPLLDPHLSADAVALVGAVLVVLRALEHRQHVVPAPAAVAERRPVVVVALLPPHVDHRVDRGAAAEDPPAGVADGAAVEPGVRLDLVAPVGAGVADGVEIADRDVDPEVVVLAARFEQQHAGVGVGRQPVGEHAPGRPGPDDDVVVRHAGDPTRADRGAGRWGCGDGSPAPSVVRAGWTRRRGNARRCTSRSSTVLLTRSSGLGSGEAESIALAGVRRLRLIVDDKQARSVAAAAGIEHVGTAGILLEAYLRGRYDMDGLEAALGDLSRVLWLSPAVVAEVLRLAREAMR